MKPTTISALAAVWGMLLCLDAAAQPTLDRLEQRAAQSGDAAQARGEATPEAEETAYVGMSADDDKELGRGVRIVRLTEDGPAAKAGLLVGDLITAINGQPIGGLDDIRAALKGKAAGIKLAFVANRQGAERQFDVTTGTRPDGKPAARQNEDLPSPAAPPAAGAGQGPMLGVRTVAVSEEVRRQNGLPDTNGATVISITTGSPASRRRSARRGDRGRERRGDRHSASFGRGDSRRSGRNRAALLLRRPADRKTVPRSPPAHQPMRKLELRGRPVAPPATLPAPSDVIPQSALPDDPRVAELKARIRALEDRVERLETGSSN